MRWWNKLRGKLYMEALAKQHTLLVVGVAETSNGFHGSIGSGRWYSRNGSALYLIARQLYDFF